MSASVDFQKLNSKTLRNQIAQQLRDAILDGRLTPGEKLVERKLAADFGASLTAVREAIILLETEGFILKRPNAATHVTKFSISDIEKVFTLRFILETHAIEEAARLATPDEIANLEALYLRMSDTARANDPRAYVQQDLQWHEAIWQIADNEFLTSTLRRLIVPLFAFTSIRLLRGTAFDLLSDASSHLPILEALRARDAVTARAAAQKIMQEWLESIRIFLLKEAGASSAREHENNEN